MPSKSGTDHFSSAYSGTEFFKITDMLVRQGSCRKPAWCLHGDAGENTDDSGARDGPCYGP